MSSTNRGAERRTDDLYETPPWAVHRLLDAGALVDWLPRNDGDEVTWLEPAAGSGAIIRAVASWCAAKRRRAPAWLARDIRDTGLRLVNPSAFAVGDFLEHEPAHWTGARRVDAILGNPPFSLAEEFVRACLAATDGPVVLLTRLGFLASATRAPLMREMAPSVYVLPDRPSFTGGGTDSADYCWLKFESADERCRSTGRISILATTPLRERRQGASDAHA